MSSSSRHARDDVKVLTIAARHIAPEHLERASVHYAECLQEAMLDGRMTRAQVDALGPEDHSKAFASIAKDNPEIARKPEVQAKAPLPQMRKQPDWLLPEPRKK